jgi:diaminohydroxyphosphoribosylaminopyrimidine deaminase/5-amino-6-(5-phosphoribosylamino)uracil reductase
MVTGEEQNPSVGGEARARPSVTVSYAQTLDGRVATATGESKWISCPDSLRFAHEMRAGHDAVLIGAGTVCSDDPLLTVRHVPGASPLRVVVDSTLRTPPEAAVLANGAAAGTVLAVTDRAPPSYSCLPMSKGVWTSRPYLESWRHRASHR